MSDVNLWLECNIGGGDIGVALDVGDGGVQALNGEGGTYRKYHKPDSSPGLCLGFSSISKSFVKMFGILVLKMYCAFTKYRSVLSKFFTNSKNDFDFGHQ